MRRVEQVTLNDLIPEEDGIMSVSELNRIVADTLRGSETLKHVSVHGELSGFKDHIASGHWYFSLKDNVSKIDCVMFRQNNIHVLFCPKDGDSVVITGYIDFFPRDGRCQLYVNSMKTEGVGNLYVKFEELKRRLKSEGLFDESRKKHLPMVPKKVAVITSETGAAIHDICNVAANRHPGIPLLLLPVMVQGESAASEIASAIKLANILPDVDVIIVGRGGGSPEDLWCFNEEIVARAIADSRIPVVSAVGHEIDFTISDFAADVRASTPSNAAEIVIPDRSELNSRIRMLKASLDRAEGIKYQNMSLVLEQTRTRIERLSPEKRLNTLFQVNLDLFRRLQTAAERQLSEASHLVAEYSESIDRSIKKKMEKYSDKLTNLSEQLEAISPMRVLERGYTMVYTPGGKLLTNAAAAGQYKRMSIRFRDSKINVIREVRMK